MKVPKENWTKYPEPFKDTCIENEIVNDDCNTHDPILESKVLYKHVNYCGVDIPCERLRLKKKSIASNISMKSLAYCVGIYIRLLKNCMPSILLFVNFANKMVILISNAYTLMTALLANFVIT